MAKFLSDNVTGACPEVLDAILATNSGSVASYGEDQGSLNLEKKLSDIFETEVLVFLAVTGTAANALALSAVTPSYGQIYCHKLSHINIDECGAPEFFTGGAKLVGLDGNNGKITEASIAAAIYGSGVVHNAQPASVSITQATEAGTVYLLDEIKAISELAHTHELRVHMDGARFANALTALNVSPAEMTWKSGVDLLSLGGTKNGCIAAEAIIFFDTKIAREFSFLHKRSGQLLSKMRFISAQFEAYLSNDVWLHNARHANAMATKLSKRLINISGIELTYPTESNEIFVFLPQSIIQGLEAEGIPLGIFELNDSAIRFVTSWATTDKDIDELLSAIKRQL